MSSWENITASCTDDELNFSWMYSGTGHWSFRGWLKSSVSSIPVADFTIQSKNALCQKRSIEYHHLLWTIPQIHPPTLLGPILVEQQWKVWQAISWQGINYISISSIRQSPHPQPRSGQKATIKGVLRKSLEFLSAHSWNEISVPREPSLRGENNKKTKGREGKISVGFSVFPP